MVNFDQQNGFSVTPFQPTAGTALPGSNEDDVGAVPVDLNHLGSFHQQHHHHHHHYHHHRRRGGHHHHHHRHLEDKTGDSNTDDSDDDEDSFGLNALELMGPPGLLLPPDPSVDEVDPLTGWPLWNHTGTTLFLPYSRILSPATSVLTIQGVHLKHAGNYTCAPSNTQPASITVHVLQGEKPAAMQHANRSQQQQQQGGKQDQASDSVAKTTTTSRAGAPVVAVAGTWLALRQLLMVLLLLLVQHHRGNLEPGWLMVPGRHEGTIVIRR